MIESLGVLEISFNTESVGLRAGEEKDRSILPNIENLECLGEDPKHLCPLRNIEDLEILISRMQYARQMKEFLDEMENTLRSFQAKLGGQCAAAPVFMN